MIDDNTQVLHCNVDCKARPTKLAMVSRGPELNECSSRQNLTPRLKSRSLNQILNRKSVALHLF